MEWSIICVGNGLLFFRQISNIRISCDAIAKTCGTKMNETGKNSNTRVVVRIISACTHTSKHTRTTMSMAKASFLICRRQYGGFSEIWLNNSTQSATIINQKPISCIYEMHLLWTHFINITMNGNDLHIRFHQTPSMHLWMKKKTSLPDLCRLYHFNIACRLTIACILPVIFLQFSSQSN